MEKIKDSIEADNNLKLKVKQLLFEIGIMPHLQGFKYWTTAVLYILELERKDEELAKFMNVYQYVGRKHKATVSKVERAMRYAYQDLNLKEKFGITRSINNSALLFLIKEKILSEK